MNNEMNEKGYEALADVLARAYKQASQGKGKDRHASGEPFTEQVIMLGARKFGTGQDHALTAMDCGLSAKEAVKMAAKRDTGTNSRVSTYTIRGYKK